MVELTREELDGIYAFAVNLGKEAGRMLLEAAQLRYGDKRPEEAELVEKESAVDLVTQTDEGKAPVELAERVAMPSCFI
jgi:myo-inositol-1(or 4)-monophosphatase